MFGNRPSTVRAVTRSEPSPRQTSLPVVAMLSMLKRLWRKSSPTLQARSRSLGRMTALQASSGRSLNPGHGGSSVGVRPCTTMARRPSVASARYRPGGQRDADALGGAELVVLGLGGDTLQRAQRTGNEQE